MLLTFSTTVMAGQAALIERLCAAVADLELRPTLTLGPAIERDAVHVPDAVEVLPFATTIGCCPSARSSSPTAASEPSYAPSPTESRC